jgi:anhydro-N-acetylmuramic acid kinase
VREAQGNLKQASVFYPAHTQWTLESVIAHSTTLHARAVKELLKKSGYQAPQIKVVGYHGQTLLHQPGRGRSVIVGDGQSLANDVGIAVVNDFRRQDIACGGQGAPLAPLYHQALAVRDQRLPLIVVNCGGIANVSIIMNSNPLDLIAFDTGPGNVLCDRLVRLRTQGHAQMDAEGHYGLKGVVDPSVLKALYAQSMIQDGASYFLKKPPKSLDSGDIQLIPELETLSLEDACRTLETFTAQTIVDSVAAVVTDFPVQWIIAGGGFKNPVIVVALQERVSEKIGNQLILKQADEIGWHSQSLEAQMFAYYAVRHLQNKPISFPNTTGVSHAVCGGCFFEPLLKKGRLP